MTYSIVVYDASLTQVVYDASLTQVYLMTDDPADLEEEPANDVPDEPDDAPVEPEFPDDDAIDGEDQPATEGE